MKLIINHMQQILTLSTTSILAPALMSSFNAPTQLISAAINNGVPHYQVRVQKHEEQSEQMKEVKENIV